MVKVYIIDCERSIKEDNEPSHDTSGSFYLIKACVSFVLLFNIHVNKFLDILSKQDHFLGT